MLMDIKCAVKTSIEINLLFDDDSIKKRLLSEGDLVNVIYNRNGVREEIEGIIIRISTNGVDPNGWYIIVDGSDNFEAEKAKFSPMNILDCEIIRKADTMKHIITPVGENAVNMLRITTEGTLEYSKDGYSWKPVSIDDSNVINKIVEKPVEPETETPPTTDNTEENSSETGTDESV